MVVSLVEDEEALRKTGRDLFKLYQQAGFEVLRLPIADFGVPELLDLRVAVGQALAHARDGRHLVVHCSAGIGRTGLFVACMARSALGLAGDAAIAWARRYIEDAVETPRQQAIVREF